jgi:hypothetical protein
MSSLVEEAALIIDRHLVPREVRKIFLISENIRLKLSIEKLEINSPHNSGPYLSCYYLLL